jgi:hypothetical protein
MAGESALNQPENDDLILKMIVGANQEEWIKYYGGSLNEVFGAVAANANGEIGRFNWALTAR